MCRENPQALEWRPISTVHDATQETKFKGDPRINSLIKNVRIDDWGAADMAAIEILKATNKFSQNALFEVLLEYQDYPRDDDALFGERT